MNDRLVEFVEFESSPSANHSRARRNRLLWKGLWVLFIAALLIRFYHLASHHWNGYLHDSASHSAYAMYVREHLRLPAVDDDFEYPQQPLYYVLAAPFCNPSQSYDQNTEHLAPLGFVISSLSLALAFGSLRYLSSWLLRYGFFVFLAFNPSFVLASACVGNDGLAVLFGTWFFFSLLRLNRNGTATRYFVLAIVVLFGALLTKLNGIVLLAAMPWLLWTRARRENTWKPTARRLGVIVLLLAVWTGAIFARAWNPASRQFVFVHNWLWDFMEIKENMLVYALRFDLSSLIAAGQASTTDVTPDIVRFSFPSWEYGNMLLGEFVYANDPVLLFCTRLVIVAGTYLLFGLVLFTLITLLSRPIWPWQKIFSLNRTALLLIVGSTCLILAFVHSAPNTCNADYRYQSYTFSWMGYGIGRGLCAFPRSSVWRNTMIGFMMLYVCASLCLLTALYIRR